MSDTMKEYIAEAEADLLHTYNRYQIVLDKGDGVYLYDIDGKKYLDFVEAYVNEVKEKQGLELNDSIYFSLSDHIRGAISRLNQGIQIQNMLLLDIKTKHTTMH